MKTIDTSVITNSKGYPALGNNGSVQVGLDFLQAAYKELAEGLAQCMSSNNSNPFILWGCVITSSDISAGAVYVPSLKEIFYVPAQTIGGSGAYINASWIANPTDVSPNQTVLSDGSQVSMHNQRTITLIKSSSPNAGNIPDYSSWAQSQIALNTSNISTLQDDITAPYASSDRVISGSVPSTETVIHTIEVNQTINSLQMMFNGSFTAPGSGAAEITIKLYIGGAVSGHTAGTMSGTISGGTLIKTVTCNVDAAYNLTNTLTAIILGNITSGQSVTATISASGTAPGIQYGCDLSLVGVIQ